MLQRIIVIFISFCLLPFPQVFAQELVLPAPGTMVQISPAFVPPLLRGIKVNPSDPFQMEFILDRGGHPASGDINEESRKLVKYFLAGLTIPEKDLWVNLSPYEKDRIVPESFGQTEMGRDLLAQDYLLKQLTASLVYPESEIGQEFWERIYKSVSNKNVPVNTFNKVWILPDKAVVYENAQNGTVYVVESKLKVLTEKDYLAADKNTSTGSNDQVVRSIVIPALTKEVNEGANFAQLRQVYNSLILAVWYKNKVKNSILNSVYADKNKVSGVNIDDPKEKQMIYERYLQAFKKGAYNFIKEEQDPLTQKLIPRKYFSGGVTLLNVPQAIVAISKTPQQNPSLSRVSVRLIIVENVRNDMAMAVKDVFDHQNVQYDPFRGTLRIGREDLQRLGSEGIMNHIFQYKDGLVIRVDKQPLKEDKYEYMQSSLALFKKRAAQDQSPNVYDQGEFLYNGKKYVFFLMDEIIGFSLDQRTANAFLETTIDERTEFFISVMSRMIDHMTYLPPDEMKPSQFMIGVRSREQGKPRGWLVDVDSSRDYDQGNSSDLAFYYASDMLRVSELWEGVIDLNKLYEFLESRMDQNHKDIFLEAVQRKLKVYINKVVPWKLSWRKDASLSDIDEKRRAAFEGILETNVPLFQSTVDFIEENSGKINGGPLKFAIASSSPSAEDMMRYLRLSKYVDLIVDGKTIGNSKGSLGFYSNIARQMGINVVNSVIIENSEAGIRSAKIDGFGFVVGLAREGDEKLLLSAGADIVVDDMGKVSMADIRSGVPNIEGIIFSDDGVIIDTESVHFKAIKNVLDDYLAFRSVMDNKKYREFSEIDYLVHFKGRAPLIGIENFLKSLGVSTDRAMTASLANIRKRIEEYSALITFTARFNTNLAVLIASLESAQSAQRKRSAEYPELRAKLGDRLQRISDDVQQIAIPELSGFKAYSEYLSLLRIEREDVYKRLQQVDIEKDIPAKARITLEAIMKNREILRVQLKIAALLVKGEGTPVNLNAALATLVGARITSHKLASYLVIHRERLRYLETKKILEKYKPDMDFKKHQVSPRILKEKSPTEQRWAQIPERLRLFIKRLRVTLVTPKSRTDAVRVVDELIIALNTGRMGISQSNMLLVQRLQTLKKYVFDSKEINEAVIEQAGVQVNGIIAVFNASLVERGLTKDPVSLGKSIKYVKDPEAHLRKYGHEFEQYHLEIMKIMTKVAYLNYIRKRLDFFRLSGEEASQEQKAVIQEMDDIRSWLEGGIVPVKGAALANVQSALDILLKNGDQKILDELIGEAVRLLEARRTQIMGIMRAQKINFLRDLAAYQERLADPQEPLDLAMSTNNDIKGGIDLKADQMKLETHNSGSDGIRFRVTPELLQRFKDAPGFTPVIINIQPLTNLAAFLNA